MMLLEHVMNSQGANKPVDLHCLISDFIIRSLESTISIRACTSSKGALAWYGKLTWESAHCLGYNFIIYGAFEFLCNSIAYL